MTETLRAKRVRFTDGVARLIDHASSLPGVEVALGQVVRTQAEASANAKSGAGISNSLHIQGLAVDLLLYINEKYMEDSEAYRPLGNFWKSLHPDFYWGGDFKKQDGNHFSLSPDGGRTR